MNYVTVSCAPKMCSAKMKEPDDIETLPTYIIGILMGLILVRGFESYFNFFVAWAKTQNPAVILSLLEGLHVRAMYKFCNKGGDADG